jgi:hypothetical protein
MLSFPEFFPSCRKPRIYIKKSFTCMYIILDSVHIIIMYLCYHCNTTFTSTQTHHHNQRYHISDNHCATCATMQHHLHLHTDTPSQPVLPHHNHCATCATMQHHLHLHTDTPSQPALPHQNHCATCATMQHTHRHTITTSAATSQPLCYHATPSATSSQPLC